MLNLGFALASLSRFDEAAATLRELVVLSPNDPGAHLLLGRVLAVLKKYDEAKSELQAAVALDPDSREARTNLDSLERLMASLPAAGR
jgi:Flp pilus assembly protein TadD